MDLQPSDGGEAEQTNQHVAVFLAKSKKKNPIMSQLG